MARYFIRFKDAAERIEAMPMLMEEAEIRRPMVTTSTSDADRTLIADLSLEEKANAEQAGAEVFDDIQFYPFGSPLEVVPEKLRYWERGALAPALVPPWMTKTVSDVMDHNRASAAWTYATGVNVTIGIVDTGIAGRMPEFPAARQSPHSKSFAFASEWSDPKGHGSMCACAAGASASSGGRYDGVAPGSQLMSLRTSLAATDIYLLYDWVIQKKRRGEFPGPVVLSNSYGRYTCGPSGIPTNHPYLDIVRLAVAEGIPVVFAAGNNHVSVCNHDPNQCSPNTIWGVNSIDEVLSVGTVNWDEVMNTGDHEDSSRGPGEWSSAHPKPDCVAPTYGEIVWGNGYRHMEWWGTSGACPQVAGLAALILERDPTLTPQQVYDAIRNNCRDLGLASECQGAGIIDCEKTVRAV